MFSPPFTLQKVIVLGALAALVWGYAIWQWRGQWVRYRRKREIIDKGGIQPARRERDGRTVFLVLVIAVALAVAGLSVCTDQFGTPAARARFHGIESSVDSFMKFLIGAVVAMVLLYVILAWWMRDPALSAVAKLTLAGKHAEAEALLREQIETKGPNEKRPTLLGLLLMDQNRLDESLQQLQEAQRLSNRPAAAKNNCALVLGKLGRREDAARLLDEVCIERPNDFVALCNSCLILAELGREAEARRRLEQAERIFARYDFKYTKNWVPQLEECRNAVPLAQGFPVIASETAGRHRGRNG